MRYIAILTILMYYFVFLNYYHKLFPAKGIRRVQLLLTLVMIGTTYMFLDESNLRWLRIPAVLAAMIAGIRFSTGMNWVQSVYGGAVSVLSAYCFRGLFTAVGTFTLQGYNFTSEANEYYIITVLALIFAYVFFRFTQRTIFPDDKLKQFINNSSQVKLVVAYEIVAVINLMIINWGRDLSPYGIWYTGLNLSTHGLWYIEIVIGNLLLTLGMLVYAVYESIQSTKLLEYQWRTKALEEQFEQQMRHYKSYQKYTENFQTFKHDYKSMMVSLKALIRAQEHEQAIQLIDDLYDDMQKRSIVHKKYSDHVVLDAMLQDVANMCEEKEIRFLFNVFAPRNTGLSMPDAIRIFSNIANNAIEACEKVPASGRFIKISSRNDPQWVTLEAVNAYNGQTHSEHGELITTKTEKESHGLGLGIVKQIAQNLGGFAIWDTDAEDKTFRIRVHIPRLSQDGQFDSSEKSL